MLTGYVITWNNELHDSKKDKRPQKMLTTAGIEPGPKFVAADLHTATLSPEARSFLLQGIV